MTTDSKHHPPVARRTWCSAAHANRSPTSWSSDICLHRRRVLYLAAVLDLHSRWWWAGAAAHIRTALVRMRC